MTIVRLLCWISFTVAVSGLVFGWATVWFAVWVICFFLLLDLTSEAQKKDAAATLAEIDAERERARRDRAAVWPYEVGAPE